MRLRINKEHEQHHTNQRLSRQCTAPLLYVKAFKTSRVAVNAVQEALKTSRVAVNAVQTEP